MYISENTKGNLEYVAHATAEDAVAHLLDSLGESYSEDFWPSKDGKSIKSSGKMYDFTIRVHAGPDAALKDLLNYDPEALPVALRALADAIDDGIKREI